MNLIECFDLVPLHNAAACLCLQPEKLVFLGDMERMEQRMGNYYDLFARRAPHTQVELHHVPMEDIQSIIKTLNSVIQEEAPCVIDVTGGDDRLLLAVGSVLAGLEEKKREKISLWRVAFQAGYPRHFDGEGRELPGGHGELTARELIGLHGGSVYPRQKQPAQYYRPGDIQPLWELVCRDNKQWNKTISYLNELENRSEDKTEIYLPLGRIGSSIQNFEEKQALVRELLEKLDRCGVITDRSSAAVLRYEYRDETLRGFLKKAGNILEVKTLLEARALTQDGQPYFCDCQMGVNIDWDGTVYPPEERVPETRNEIDVLLVRGMIPLFISCKNGDIKDDELYKLKTVAERFGGPYAKKMLIATELERKGAMSLKAYRQRAKDMGIYLVTDAAALTAKDWQRIFREAMEM